MAETDRHLGATCLADGSCEFRVWAPAAGEVAVRLLHPQERLLAMRAEGNGYWGATIEDVHPGARYLYRLGDSHERPDPASGFQPEGVHGPSAVVGHAAFPWSDGGWRGVPQQEWVIYELHVGTFTAEGTFAAIIPYLSELRGLGVTAIELMPVAQFPGERNWGYDGVFPFAVQASYGGPEGLRRLVNACHAAGLAVFLDVVYNHLGPEGNTLRDFGPYFTDRYRTPWGEAVNLDGPESDEVRRFFFENARHWFCRYHIDALRLDAVHAIFDSSASPFLVELAVQTRELAAKVGRPLSLIAESDLNDARLIRPPEAGGCGLDAQWSDDFHHALHTLLTGERQGYYQDFGRPEDLATALQQGFVYDGRRSAYRRRRHGNSAADRPGSQFVVCSQNHDQVGNRMQGERLITLAGFAAAKVAAAAVLLSPFVPLLFMGEEYGEEAPFLYFVSFPDPHLAAAVRQGRREEFNAFSWTGEPPAPQAAETFRRSRLDREHGHAERRQMMREWYRRLLRLRRQLPALSELSMAGLDAGVPAGQKALWLHRRQGEDEAVALFNFSTDIVVCDFPATTGRWKKLIDSAATAWQGPGAGLPETLTGGTPLAIPPVSCALYRLRS